MVGESFGASQHGTGLSDMKVTSIMTDTDEKKALRVEKLKKVEVSGMRSGKRN